MPVSPIVSAIVSSIIEGVADQATSPAAVQPPPGPAVGQVRTLPAESQQGELTAAAVDRVRIDGRTINLAPGAQIRNELNMIMLPTMVQPPARVRYTTDNLGSVSRIWILTPPELAASR